MVVMLSYARRRWSAIYIALSLPRVKHDLSSEFNVLGRNSDLEGEDMKRQRTLRIIVAAVLAVGLLVEEIATAQVDPEGILAEVISQLQTGTPNPSFYGIQLWQMISMQTAGRGIYPQLVQLGDVQDI